VAPQKAKSRRIRSLKGPVILFAVAMVCVVALLVLWNYVLARDYQRIRELVRTPAVEADGSFHWAFIAIGSVIFVATIVLLSVLGAQLFAQIRFSQRLSQSIATLTHELNSPLAAIKMFAQTLRRSPELGPDEQRRFLDLILVDVERLGRQITNVLHTAQLDSLQGFRITPATTHLRPLLEDYVEKQRAFLERLQGDSSIELKPGPSALVRLDRSAFEAVLDNLIGNAIKYARPGGVRITLGLSATGREDRVAIEVVDDGVGIAPADLERVFDRFGRADSPGAGPRQGTGLGLWIVEAIVEAHHGRVRALSPGPGQGTTIRIELPCEHFGAEAPAESGRVSGPLPESAGG